jgi:nicotinamide mononucleotide adenylyltransferase
MAQTFFIDSDEEIISVIGYLRKSPEAENYFVFPKRSLVLQSAVNLRLFQREALDVRSQEKQEQPTAMSMRGLLATTL